jgi:hypothetical protein
LIYLSDIVMTDTHPMADPEPSLEGEAVPAEPVPMDPRAEKARDELVRLVNSAQGIWRDALQSQVRLTQYIDQLQIQITEIKQYTAVPAYPAGLKRLQASHNRILAVKKRIATVGSRLTRLSNTLAQQKLQRQRQQDLIAQREAQRQIAETAAKPPEVADPSPPPALPDGEVPPVAAPEAKPAEDSASVEEVDTIEEQPVADPEPANDEPLPGTE